MIPPVYLLTLPPTVTLPTLLSYSIRSQLKIKVRLVSMLEMVPKLATLTKHCLRLTPNLRLQLSPLSQQLLPQISPPTLLFHLLGPPLEGLPLTAVKRVARVSWMIATAKGKSCEPLSLALLQLYIQ